MAIGRDEQTGTMFQGTSPIVIPPSPRDKKNKDIRIKLSGNSVTLKSNLYHKRTNYRNSSFSSTSPSNSLKTLHTWSFGQASQKPKHPLGDLCDDDGIEVYDYDPTQSEDFDYSDDISLCSCSSTSSSNYSPSFTHITRKSLSNSVLSNINVPSDTKHTSNSTSRSSDSLLRILNESSDTRADPRSMPGKNLVSNLTSSLKNWGLTIQKSSQSIWTYSLTPRMTDDVIPSSDTFRKENFQEMTTFNMYQTPETELPVKTPGHKAFRNRDQRINSAFLRLYSFDYNARMNGTLPNTYSNEEIVRLLSRNRSLIKFHEKNNLFTVSEASREKLWHNVILPPRSDPSPGTQVDVSAYVYVGDEDENDDDDEDKIARPSVQRHSSLISSIGNCLPWNSSKSSFKPAGVLEHGRVHLNGQSPNSGITKTQFTVKGWCNSRWLETKAD